MKAGRDFHLAFSPERIDPGRTDYTVRTMPKLVGGITPPCAERARELYELVCDEVVVSYHDPFVPKLPELELESVPLDEGLGAADLAAIVTAHPGIDYGEVVAAAPATIDFRGVTREIESPSLVRL